MPAARAPSAVSTTSLFSGVAPHTYHTVVYVTPLSTRAASCATSPTGRSMSWRCGNDLASTSTLPPSRANASVFVACCAARLRKSYASGSPSASLWRPFLCRGPRASAAAHRSCGATSTTIFNVLGYCAEGQVLGAIGELLVVFLCIGLRATISAFELSTSAELLVLS